MIVSKWVVCLRLGGHMRQQHCPDNILKNTRYIYSCPVCLWNSASFLSHQAIKKYHAFNRQPHTYPKILTSTRDIKWLISLGGIIWWLRLPLALLAWLLFVLCVTHRAGQRGCREVTNVSRWVISSWLYNKQNGIKFWKWKQIRIPPSVKVMQWPWTDLELGFGYFARGCTKVI